MSKLSNQCLKVNDAVGAMKGLLHAKLDALLETQSFWGLTDQLSTHPYSTFPALAIELDDAFVGFYAGFASWKVNGIMVAEEIDLLKAAQIVNDGTVAKSVQALSLIKATYESALQVADRLYIFNGIAIKLWSFYDNKSIKELIATNLGNRAVANSIEKPIIDLAPKAKELVKEIRKLAKLLAVVDDGEMTLNQAMDEIDAAERISNPTFNQSKFLHLRK
jgi:hypothetical protein